MTEPQTAIVLSHWHLGNHARCCFLEPRMSQQQEPQPSGLYTQTPGIQGCEGVRQNKAVVRQSEEPAPTSQTGAGGTLLPVCLSVPVDPAKAP